VHGAVASLLIEEEGGPALKIDWAAAGPKVGVHVMWGCLSCLTAGLNV
jgi:hypothetical protein